MPDTDTTPEISQEAARAMLAALRDMVINAEVCGWGLDTVDAVILDAARAAIAQAEGRA